jgi:hypothetical protein
MGAALAALSLGACGGDAPVNLAARMTQAGGKSAQCQQAETLTKAKLSHELGLGKMASDAKKILAEMTDEDRILLNRLMTITHKYAGGAKTTEAQQELKDAEEAIATRYGDIANRANLDDKPSRSGRTISSAMPTTQPMGSLDYLPNGQVALISSEAPEAEAKRPGAIMMAYLVVTNPFAPTFDYLLLPVAGPSQDGVKGNQTSATDAGDLETLDQEVAKRLPAECR